MRTYILLCFLVLILVITVTECRKKYKWDSSNSLRKEDRRHHMRTKLSRADNTKQWAMLTRNKKKSHRPSHPHHKGHKKSKKGKMSHLHWLNIKKGAECDMDCKPVEVCILGPVDKKPLCVHKKDLKKSLKLFHRYHKKEMKAWRRFQKKHYKKINKMRNNVYDFEDRKQPSLSEVGKKKKFYLEKINKDRLWEEEKGKDTLKKQFESIAILPETVKDQDEECSSSQFSQMRTRMMGWFHLLHGQDHLARKQHGGSLAKFHKHVSVKKELREHNGNQCQCFKSAMWQFNEMDRNKDDHLNDEELQVMEENSLEPCMKPYLTSCDHNGDGKFSSDEWCCCFSNIVAPCFKKLDEIRRSGEPVTYMPRCDKEGYYMREQCKGDGKGTMTCWCVDYNGNMFKGSDREGRAHCTKLALQGLGKKVPLA